MLYTLINATDIIALTTVALIFITILFLWFFRFRKEAKKDPCGCSKGSEMIRYYKKKRKEKRKTTAVAIKEVASRSYCGIIK